MIYQKLWHIPNSLHIPPENFLKEYKKLNKNDEYLLYCTYGTQTPYFAEIMQQNGFNAYAFKGGLSKVKSQFKH